MRSFLTGLLILIFVQIRASDTLTRAQVYSFGVGDTFDYQHYHYESYYNGYVYVDTSYSNYFRKVVTNIYYSVDSATKFIERTEIYPPPVAKDTLVLTNLKQCELCLDTSNYFQPCTLTFMSNSAYERTLNVIVVYQGGPPEPYERDFAAGLGEVKDVDQGGYLGGQWDDRYELIYYADSSSTWGSPYYTFSTGIESLSNSESIVYPTLNDGKFRLATALDKPPVEFLVYDILGKVVLHQIITANNTLINLQQYGSGVYVWKLTEQSKIAGSGKIVVQR